MRAYIHKHTLFTQWLPSIKHTKSCTKIKGTGYSPSLLALAPVSFPTWKVLQTLHSWCRDSYQCKVEDNLRFLKSQVQQGKCIVAFPRRSCIMW